MIETTYWNGEETPATRGTAVVADAAVVLIAHGAAVRSLDNRDGTGWLKVTKGLGSPNVGHGNVAVQLDSFRPLTPGETVQRVVDESPLRGGQ